MKKSLKNWQIRTFILCWIAYACIYFGRVNLSIAIPQIQHNFGWTKTQIGFIGSMFFWVYGIGQMINGYLGDKVSSRLFIFIGLLVTAIANILFGFAASLAVMLLLWAINGYFQSMLWGPMSKTLSFWFPYEKRSRIGIGISTSMVAGYILAWGLCAKILILFNWRYVFWIPGGVILTFSLVWYRRAKNHPKDVGLECPNIHIKSDNTKQDIQITLWSVICKTKLWFVVLGCFAQGVIKEGIGLWGPTFLMETQKIDIKATVGLLMMIPIMNFGGMMLAGWLNNKFKYQEKLAAIVLLIMGMLMVICLVVFKDSGPIIELIFLGSASAMMFGANTMLLGVFPMSFAKYNKVSAIAGFLDFCSYLAAGFAAFFTGSVVDKFGWGGILIIWIAIAGIGITSLIISYKNDYNN